MAAPPGSAPPVEDSPSMELRAYVVRPDGKGGAVELGRLQHCSDSQEAKASLRSSARARSPTPSSSSDNEAASDFGGMEAATIYLVVFVEGAVKKVARLSSFMEGPYCTQKVAEANAGIEASSKEHTDDEAEEERDDDKAHAGTDSDVSISSQKEEQKTPSQVETGGSDTCSNSSSHEEEEVEEEEAHAGTDLQTPSQEEDDLGKKVEGDVSESSSLKEEISSQEEETTQTSSSQEEQTDESSYTSSSGAQYSLQIRLWPESARLVLVLFDLGCWKLTRGYHVSWLDRNEEQVLDMFGLGSEETCSENSDPKQSFVWPENRTSWLDFKGSLEYSDHLEQIISEEFSPSMDDFCVNGVLGDGGSGNVYQCSYMNSPIPEFQYAIKIMNITDEHDCIDTINFKEPREVSIMSAVKDDYVVSFYQAWAANGTYKSDLSSDKQEHVSEEIFKMNLSLDFEEFACGISEARYVAIQMERCSRTLKQDLPNGPCEINVEDSWMNFEEITKAVQFIHHKGIIHRDLKPSNLLFGSDGTVKICDLGHACWSASKIGESVGTPNRGSLLYMAPELDGGPVTNKVDIYSLGVIFLELFHPFSTVQEEDEVLRELRNDIYPIDWKGDKVFLKRLLALQPSDRPSTDEILEYIAKRRQDICAQH